MKNFSKAIFAVILLSVMCAVNAGAQIRITDDIGKPIAMAKYTDVVGSPFLSDDWSKGSVKLAATDDKYVNTELKYSDMENKLYFKGTSGESMEFVTPVVEFKIVIADKSGTTERHFIRSLEGPNDKTYYEIVADGKTKFVKQLVKTIQEQKEYGSSRVTKSFDTAERYFIYTNGKLTAAKKDKKAIIDALGSKQTELDAYAKANNISFKKDADIVKFITYYNTLN